LQNNSYGVREKKRRSQIGEGSSALRIEGLDEDQEKDETPRQMFGREKET